MTPEKQRIVIAEFCLPKWQQLQYGNGGVWYFLADGGWNKVPDYLSDLNVMHEAEKLMNDSQKAYFVGHLMQIVPNDNPNDCIKSVTRAKFKYINATSAQRAEALLRTIGKWEEE